MDELEIRISYTSVRHPQANPVERTMKEIGRLCRTYCQDAHQSWAVKLKQFNTWLNLMRNDTTGFAPYQLHTGRQPPSLLHELIVYPGEAADESTETWNELAHRNLQVKAAERSRRAKKKNVSFAQGDFVLLKSNHISSQINAEIKKFFQIFEGPFVLKKNISSDTFVLVDPATNSERGIFHSALLRPYHQRL